MTESLILLAPVLILLVVALFPFVGCTGRDLFEEGKKEGKKEGVEIGKQIGADSGKKEAEQAEKAAEEAALYPNVIAAEPDLVGYWRLDELEDGKTDANDGAPDKTWKGTYMHLAGMFRFQTGALLPGKYVDNRAVRFLGTSGFVEVGHHALLNPPLDFTVEAWVQPDGIPADPQVVAGAYETGANGALVRGFVLEVLPGATPQAPPRLRARVGNGDGSTAIEAGLGDGSEYGGWRHVAMTYHGATSALKLYVNPWDGKPDQEITITNLWTDASGTQWAYKANQAQPFRIAAGHAEAPVVQLAGPGRFFKGLIDEVALYRVALGGDRLRNHFLAAITP